MSIRCDIGLFDANPSIDHQSVASTRQVIYGPSITDGHRLTGHRHRLAQVTSIYRQSIGDQLVTNLGTRVLWRPTEVSSRRTNRTAPIHCQLTIHCQARPISKSITNPGLLRQPFIDSPIQSSTNLPIQYKSANPMPILNPVPISPNITDTSVRCQSRSNLPINYYSGTPIPRLCQSADP